MFLESLLKAGTDMKQWHIHPREHGAKPQQSKGGNRSGAPRSHMKKWRPFVEARAYAQAQQLKTGQITYLRAIRR